ncbi:MAG TPA: beta-ketoacyl synthase N-terminal-like domain-containing protein [Bryobacteraceae bacterium]|nr:beta-ketoacyl synthase N-terminal-like domain-containing protein [Bryobacteraceae bacterium]
MSAMDSDATIAVVGMSGRFPGAKNIHQFWQNLRNGVESISFSSRREAVEDGVPPEVAEHPDAVFAGGVLEEFDCFDAEFFGFTPKEAEIMDPQQRVFLECAWSALEDAGYDSARYPGRIGVVASVSASKYFLEIAAHQEVIAPLTMFQVLVDNDKDLLATRTSYKLNLRGPSLVVQTACSSSLVAIHIACQSLLGGECDAYLVGGSSVKFLQKPAYVYKQGGIGSPDGHCRAFDADARGMVSGDGVAVVVLKRLSDAIADQDHIYAVIRGTAINNDGSEKVGFTAPSIQGQAAVVAEAQTVAGVAADTVAYIEAHGTGTSLGDPIEVAALKEAFRQVTGRRLCGIGSVKTNVGHLDAAAGITGLVKSVLVLKYREVPPSLHFHRANPALGIEDSPFYIVHRLQSLPLLGERRRVGVSSFGIGGTNAHAVLEEAPEIVGPAPEKNAYRLLTLSAKTGAALDRMTMALADYLSLHRDLYLEDVSFTLLAGRRTLSHRRSVVASNMEEAAVRLKRSVGTGSCCAPEAGRPICFMFPGQGAQYVQMTSTLFETEPIYREELTRCAELLQAYLDCDIRPLLFPESNNLACSSDRIQQTEFTQPVLFAVEFALARLYISRGVEPEALLGHSIGEYVAACVSGVFSLKDSLRIVAQRGKLMQSTAPGKMVAIPLEEARVRSMLNGDLFISGVGGSKTTVVSGSVPAVTALMEELKRTRTPCMPLKTSHGFHCPAMLPVKEALRETVSRAQLGKPRIPFLSNVTGEWIREEQATDPDYWATQMCRAVRIPGRDSAVLKSRPWVFLEVGPGRTLSNIVSQENGRRANVISPLTQNSRMDEAEQFYTGLANLWVTGAKFDTSRLFERHGRRVSLPTYPFERTRYFAAFPWTKQKGITSQRPSQVAEAGADEISVPGLIRCQLETMAKHLSQLNQNGRERVTTPLTPVQMTLLRSSTGNINHWTQSVLLEAQEDADVDRLIHATSNVLRQHDAFSLRFESRNNAWLQYASGSRAELPFSVTLQNNHDLTRFCAELKRSLNIEGGPVIKCGLIRMQSSREKYLFATAHHLVCDRHSWQVFIDDVERAYRQINGRPFAKPGGSFLKFAHSLACWTQSPEAEAELAYWSSSERRAAQNLPLDFSGSDLDNTFGSADSIDIETPDSADRLGQKATSELVLSILGAALVEWSGRDSLLVDVERLGREQITTEADILGSIGCFTTFHPVLFTRNELDPGQALFAIQKQLRSVVHGGIGHGALRCLSRKPSIRAAMAVCPPAEIAFDTLTERRTPFCCSKLLRHSRQLTGDDADPRLQRPHVLHCRAHITNVGCRLEVIFSTALHSRDSIKRLANMISARLEERLREPALI